MAKITDFINILRRYDDNSTTFDEVLSKPESLEGFRQFVRSLPPESCETLSQLSGVQTKSTKSTKSRPRIKRALNCAKKVEAISLPSALLPEYEKWKAEPSTFFILEDFDQTTPNADIKTMLDWKIRQTSTLTTRPHLDAIRWRFYTLFYYDLIQLVRGGSSRSSQKIVAEAYHQITGHPLSSDKVTEISKWASAGMIYHNINLKLGAGSLFWLPESMSRSTLEQTLPKTGDGFLEPLKYLEKIGILKVSEELGADSVAKNIRRLQIEPYQFSYNAKSRGSTSGGTHSS